MNTNKTSKEDTIMTHYAKLQVFYTAMYDYLKAHPEFDGTAHPDHQPSPRSPWSRERPWRWPV